MEVGLGQRDGIPADEMRVAGFVRALVEIGPEGLREDGRVVAEDEFLKCYFVIIQKKQPQEGAVLIIGV